MHESDWTTATAIGSHKTNEDTFGVIDTRQGPQDGHLPIAVVCDGLGGHSHGEVAARVAAEAFLERFVSPEAGGSVDMRLRNAAGAANRAVHEQKREQPRLYGMATTLTAAAITDNGLAWIGIGDSPLLHWRAHTCELYCVNALHNPPGTPNRVTSAVTGDPLSEVDWPMHAIPLRPGDAVIVASDGIDTLKRYAIAGIAAADAGQRPSRLAQRLLEAVEAAGNPKQDNTTLACLRVGNGHASRPETRGVIEGRRTESGATVTVDGKRLDPEVSLAGEKQAPTGFEWGCDTRGTSQLALAIALEIVGEECAIRGYQEFKREFLCTIRSPEWRLATSDVETWLSGGGRRAE